MNERDLLCQFKTARERLDDIKAAQKDAQAVFDQAEMQLVEHLIASNAEGTAEYSGIGRAKLKKPRIYASFLKENEDAAKKYLEEHGRKDLIKETVAPASLSSFVGELIEAGKPVPAIFTYYLKQSVGLY